MRDSTVFDDGVRLTSLIQLRVPPDFRERMQAAAAAERLTLTEFARRAIAERMVNGTAVTAQTPPPPDAPSSIAPRSSVAAATPAPPAADAPAPRDRSSRAWTQP